MKIKTNIYDIRGLDYNNNLDLIAVGSNSIQLWDGVKGTLVIEKLNVDNNPIAIE